MSTPLPVLGEVFLIAMSSLVAIYEGWLFWHGGKRTHLWTAILAVEVIALCSLMLVHFGVSDPQMALVLTRIEGAVITAMAHSMLVFTVAVTGKRLPGPRHWVPLSWALFTALMLSPWLVKSVAPMHMALLPEPFLRRVQNGPLIAAHVYGFALIGLATYWMHRHRHVRPHEARYFIVGVAMWVAFGLVAALGSVVSTGPYAGGMLEYGFVAFVVCLMAAHGTHYVVLLAQSRAAQKKTEVELSAVQRRELKTAQNFVALIDNAPDPMAICHGDAFARVNQAMATCLGYDSPDELEALRYDDILGAADEEDAESTGGPSLVRWRCKDGSVRHVSISELDVEIDKRPATVIIGRDVTEQRELTARTMKLDRMIAVGTLAAGVGHEINNPLSYVLMSVEHARHCLTEPEVDRAEIDEVLGDAEEGARRIAVIVDSLRSASRADDGQQSAPISDAVEAAIAMTAHQAKHRASVRSSIESTQCVLANHARLTQVFVNLIMNAVHALPDDASNNLIEVRVWDQRDEGEDRVVVDVIDNGCGMTAETQKRAFDPFYTTKPIGVGTGLGLSICQDTLTAIGGRIDLESTYGRGTTVRTWLPVSEPVRKAVEPRQQKVVKTSRRAVLVVDDERILLRTIERALAPSFDVTTVGAAEEALSLLADGLEPVLILSDLMMPKMSGMQLHAEVKKRFPAFEARMLFMTGGAFTPESKRFSDAMNGRVISKPISVSTIKQTIVDHATGATVLSSAPASRSPTGRSPSS